MSNSANAVYEYNRSKNIISNQNKLLLLLPSKDRNHFYQREEICAALSCPTELVGREERLFSYISEKAGGIVEDCIALQSLSVQRETHSPGHVACSVSLNCST